MLIPRRAEVWIVDFGKIADAVDGEIAKPRPAVILSANWVIDSRAEILHVVPASTKDKGVETHVDVQPPEGGLERESFFQCEQLRIISPDRLDRDKGAIGRLEPSTMDEIERHLSSGDGE